MSNGSNGSSLTVIAERIRHVLNERARLGTSALELPDDFSLYEAGMTSLAGVNVMLLIEDAFDIEFPDRMLRREVFESIGSIRAAVAELLADGESSRLDDRAPADWSGSH
jgi:acyl carrier protein